jgi:hypothetical protein
MTLADRIAAIEARANAATRFSRLVHKDVSVPNGCWYWIGSLTNRGYGHFRLNGHFFGAHRVSYELVHGPIPAGMEIDHLCKMPLCVNPAHLEAVTGVENNRRSESPTAINGRKTHCIRGHEFTPENTYREPRGRHCRKCQSRAALASIERILAGGK